MQHRPRVAQSGLASCCRQLLWQNASFDLRVLTMEPVP